MGGDTVADIKDSPAFIHLSADRFELVDAGGQGAFRDASARDVGIGARVGGGGAGEEVDEEEGEEEESSHGGCCVRGQEFMTKPPKRRINIRVMVRSVNWIQIYLSLILLNYVIPICSPRHSFPILCIARTSTAISNLN